MNLMKLKQYVTLYYEKKILRKNWENTNENVSGTDNSYFINLLNLGVQKQKVIPARQLMLKDNGLQESGKKKVIERNPSSAVVNV